MRSRISRFVLMLQPVFLLIPPIVLGLLLSAAGWSFGTTLVTVLAAGEGALAVQKYMRTRARRGKPVAGPAEGVGITRADGNAHLWSVVDDASAAAGVTPPARIVLTLSSLIDVNPLEGDGSRRAIGAAVSRGAYELMISPVLLSEAKAPQLRAVVVHEIARCMAAGSAEKSPVTRVLRTRTLPVYHCLSAGQLKLGAWVHLRLWLRVNAWAERPVDRVADQVAFQTSGPQTTAAALNLVERLVAAQDIVVSQYLPLAVRAGLRPLIIDGVHELLAAPAGSHLDDRMATKKPGRYVAAAQKASASGVGAEADAHASQWGHVSALDLLDGGRAWLASHEVDLLNEDHQLHRAPEADWATLVDVGWRSMLADMALDMVHSATTAADAKGRPLPLDGPVPAPIPARPEEVTARMFLTAVDRLGHGQVGLGRALHEPKVSRDTALGALQVVLSRALDRTGHLRARLSWSGPAVQEYFDGTQWLPMPDWDDKGGYALHDEAPLGAALGQVIDGAPASVLIDELIRAGADVDAPISPSAAERADRPGSFLGAHAGVQVSHGGQPLAGAWIAIIGTTGVWLVPEHFQGSKLDPAYEEAQRELMGFAARSYVDAGGPDRNIWPRSWWLPEVGIAQVEAHGDAAISAVLTGVDGTVTRLQMPAMAPSLGTHARHALREVVGNRMQVD